VFSPFCLVSFNKFAALMAYLIDSGTQIQIKWTQNVTANGVNLTFQAINHPLHVEQLYGIMQQIIEDGETYPQDTMDFEQFKQYYCSHHVFGLIHDQVAIAAFYVKPNFPGRCSHICNAGFIVSEKWRGKGVGGILADYYEIVARELGYKASYFNLVFENNNPSLALWKKRGYSITGKIPNAGLLKKSGWTAAFQVYKSFD
jgi:GNAT superfamily N-acetyltransferase